MFTLVVGPKTTEAWLRMWMMIVASNLMKRGWCNKSMIMMLAKGLSSLGKRPTEQVTSSDINNNHAGKG